MNVRLTWCVCTLILCLVKFLSFNNLSHYLCHDSRSYAIRECLKCKIRFILLISFVETHIYSPFILLNLMIMYPRIRLSSSSLNYSLGEILNHSNIENIWQISLIRGILWKLSLCLGYKPKEMKHVEKDLYLLGISSLSAIPITVESKRRQKNDFFKSNYQKAIHLAWVFQSMHPWSHFLNLPSCLLYGFVCVCVCVIIWRNLLAYGGKKLLFC